MKRMVPPKCGCGQGISTGICCRDRRCSCKLRGSRCTEKCKCDEGRCKNEKRPRNTSEPTDGSDSRELGFFDIVLRDDSSSSSLAMSDLGHDGNQNEAGDLHAALQEREDCSESSSDESNSDKISDTSHETTQLSELFDR